MDTLLFVPAIDDRYGGGKISTRIGLTRDAITFNEDVDMFAYISRKLAENTNIKCVLIDEAQFLTRAQVLQLGLVTDEHHIPVLAYGIRTDFQAEPFEGSLYLLALGCFD